MPTYFVVPTKFTLQDTQTNSLLKTFPTDSSRLFPTHMGLELLSNASVMMKSDRFTRYMRLDKPHMYSAQQKHIKHT